VSAPHNPGRLVPVVGRKNVLTDEKVSTRGRTISLRWIYDTHETLACGCVIVYPRSSPRSAERRRCRGAA
jgi:hypothetical protein